MYRAMTGTLDFNQQVGMILDRIRADELRSECANRAAEICEESTLQVRINEPLAVLRRKHDVSDDGCECAFRRGYAARIVDGQS